jgi:hypothetical protein
MFLYKTLARVAYIPRALKNAFTFESELILRNLNSKEFKISSKKKKEKKINDGKFR